MHRKMIVLLSCGLMAASAASAGGAGAKPTTKPTAMPAAKCMSIADTVANNAQFSTLLVALQAAGLVDTLKSGQYTVFAPTDAAFNKLPSDVLSGVLNDPALLKSVLLYHVVPGKVNAKQVMNLKSIKTAQGATLSVQMMGSKVMINGANVVQADVPACNGVIHVVDTVLLPPMTAMKPAAPAVAATPAPAPAATDDTMTSDNGMADNAASTDTGTSDAAAAMPTEMAQAPAAATPSSIPATPLTMPMPVDSGAMSVDTTVATDTAAAPAATTDTAATDTTTADTTMADVSMGDNTIYDVIVNDDRFGTLRSLLSDADLTETLMGGTYTLFAPTDEAFAKVDPDTLAKIASDPALLKQVLLYHVVAGNLTGEQVTGSTQLASAEGQSLNVTKDGNNVKINDATVTAVDMKASNGVVHVIDSVLIPPDLKLP
ncbi:fasciclin domain-containing protein [Deinococcus detaillensis]|uniref:Fasciclin domain-containing protein n=1 Tax=Deinococcus detaillensis TaxID=2592048 RepID=A0A553V0V7_9DEIO|nr:fasciclin domain-containing protein [Deinococcus detaillensis]TSA86092.1 fasciclin domain-containing protein [Deinococcus detaillensis]